MAAKKKKSQKAPVSTLKPQKPTPVRKVFSKALLIRLFVIGLAGFLIFFFYIDSKVATRLSSGQPSTGSHILSDAKTYRFEKLPDLEILRKALQDRSYRQVTSQQDSTAKDDKNDLAPGEYIDLKDKLIIYPRSFTDNQGKDYSANVQQVLANSPVDLTLEPRSLANLSSADSRVSKFVSLSKIPKQLQQAVIAIEDERFYSHLGIDPVGIARAIFVNISKGSLSQGGSTLTQQLAKNLFFSSRRSLLRKLMEIPTAISLELRLSKDQIMEMYLNEIYLGQNGSIAIHGMAEAAKAFYGKSLTEINLAESALLAGIIQAPSLYAPRKHISRAAARKNQVLQKMLELKLISQKEYDTAKATKIKIVSDSSYRRTIPYFTSSLREVLSEQIDFDAATQQGISVKTGIDPDFQECAEKVVVSSAQELENRSPSLKRKVNPLQVALVAIEPFSGKVKAWVGGRDFSRSQFDRVIKAKRQIGSTIKPFVYLTALDGSLNSYKTATAISILKDQPLSIKLPTGKIWSPENYDHEFRGEVTLRYALENSLNIPAVNITQKYGIKALGETLRILNLKQSVADLPSLALGALDTNLLSLTSAYAALANNGRYVKPRLFSSVTQTDGGLMLGNTFEEHKIADEGATFVLTSILEGVVERGTGKSIRTRGYKGPAAGKTGTTNDARDAWFIGYTPELAAGVWIGFDDNKKIGLTGGQSAAPIWADFMKCAEKSHQFEDFIAPPSVSLVDIDPVSGLLFNNECPGSTPVKEYFVNGTEPKAGCNANAPMEGISTEELEPRRRSKSLWEDLFG